MSTNFSSDMKDSWNLRASKDAYHYVENKFWSHDKAEFFALGKQRAKMLIDPVLSKFQIDGAGSTSIDIGCGVGRFTQALGRRFDKAIGVDVSDIMVAQALEAAHGFTNLDFISSDGVSIPQPDASADFVWCYEVFQHMPSRDVIQCNLREITRVLRPSGYALLHFKSSHEYPPLWHIARFLPVFLISWTKRILGKDPLTADASWRGARPVGKSDIQIMCAHAGLSTVEFRDDPTHEPGTRVFAVVKRATH